MDKFMFITFVFGFLLLASVEGCLLPFSDGDWRSSTRGTWTTSNNGTHSTIANFEADLTLTVSNPELTCVSSSGTQYIFGTTFEIFTFVFINVYTCIDIRTTSASPNSYVYYMVTPTDANTGEQFTSDLNSACTNSNFETAINTHILLKKDSETSAAVDFPDDILGSYTVTYSDVNGNSITGCDMDSCNDTKLMVFNNTDSNTKLAFTNDNVLQCLHTVTSGSSVYVHTYNTDTTAADNINTFSIACWVIVNSGTQVRATVYPNECLQDQSSTSVAYGGQKFTFTPRYTCPLNQSSSSSGLAGWVIALIVLGVIAAIFIIVLIILYIRYVRKERHVRDGDEESIVKEDDRNPSPDSLSEKDRIKAKNVIKRDLVYESGFDEKDLKPRDKLLREHTLDLKEVTGKPTKKLQNGKNVDKETVLPKAKDTQQPVKPIEFPPGKKPIPPTTPKPEAGDSALLRIKHERERKEKEKQKREKQKQDKEAKVMKEMKEEKPSEEKVDKVIKNVKPSSSSDEYETDESEKEERINKLIQKRKRLAAAAYQPPEGLPDAKVVGKKKRRGPEGEEAGDLTKTLMNREQQELEDKKRRQRKKGLRKMAKKKLKGPSDVETSDSEADASGTKRRHKRRKVGDARVKDAPFTQLYHVKKDIEKELDDIDFWNEKIQPTAISDDEELDEEGNVRKRAIQVVPVDTAHAPNVAEEKKTVSRLEQIMEEEADVWAAHGLKGFKLGRGGELPDGFHFDDEGNIVRDVDGKLIPKEAFAKQMDNRKKFGFVFSLPRLIRSTDGRPLGGYKDDEFGPTAEWDYGLPSNTDDEDELKKLESFRPVSGKQVAFSVQDGQSVQATPLNDLEYSEVKGRQLGSAERAKLKERLFEPKLDSEVQTTVPVYFKPKIGGVKPESVYIDNTQVERQDNRKTGPKQTKQNMVVRSDTFDDGRRINRNSKLRASWSGREARIPYIPEEEENEKHGIQGISRGKRNIGSDDEFVLVPGSMQKLNKPPETTDSHLSTHWCTRYERQANIRSREPTEMSDLNMHTAPSSHRPFSGDDRRMKHLLPEFYTDKKYFEHYLDSEKLPTNATVETRGLVSHGLEFLNERAEYWKERQPVNPQPPPSELALRLSRMHTFYTAADSGMDSMISSATGRPRSADDAQESARTGPGNPVRVPLLNSNRSVTTEDTKQMEDTERKPPTGRSEFAPSPSKVESLKKEKTVTIDVSPREKENLKPEQPKRAGNYISAMPGKEQTVSDEYLMPGNVLSITDS